MNEAVSQSGYLPNPDLFDQRNLGNNFFQTAKGYQVATTGSKPGFSAQNPCKGSCSDYGNKSIIQPKLMIGPANDVYEQEADRIADNIVGLPDYRTYQPPLNTMNSWHSHNIIQRESDKFEHIGEVTEQPETGGEQLLAVFVPPSDNKEHIEESVEPQEIQRKSVNNISDKRTISLPQNLKLNSNSGKSIPENVKSKMDHRFGTDFAGGTNS